MNLSPTITLLRLTVRRCCKASAAALLLFCFLSLPVGTNAQADGTEGDLEFALQKGGEFVIGGVRVEGATHFDGRILATLSGLAKGDKIKIPGDEIPKAIKVLWKQKLFVNVSVEAEKIVGNQVFLVIHVEERPTIGGRA